MARRSKQTFQKRQREKARQERRQEKEARRAEARERKANLPPRDDTDGDPDIAGIVPGPQPLPPQFWDEE
ncbi:MAG: hypothetical protein D6708_07160 [Candidatus Dadabacteria bacterium]|nr:MAG: hypothetical protein D6708_07160 [Candidatus Dadabacteria bacterium]